MKTVGGGWGAGEKLEEKRGIIEKQTERGKAGRGAKDAHPSSPTSRKDEEERAVIFPTYSQNGANVTCYTYTLLCFRTHKPRIQASCTMCPTSLCQPSKRFFSVRPDPPRPAFLKVKIPTHLRTYITLESIYNQPTLTGTAPPHPLLAPRSSYFT